MQADPYIADLRAGLSSARFDTFVRAGDSDDYDRLARYLWNAQLCEALYLPLHWVEVLLRNNLFGAVSASYPPGYSTPIHVPCWLDYKMTLLAEGERKKVDKAKERMTKAGKDMTPGQLVAHLDVNFWVKLLHAPYNEKSKVATGAFWPRLLDTVFPHVERRYRSPAAVKGIFEDIRVLRNRVFHHEPIFGTAAQNHEMLLRAIAWLNPAAADHVEQFDRFRAVFDLQPGYFRERLERIRKSAEEEVSVATAISAVVDAAFAFTDILAETSLLPAAQTLAAIFAAQEEAMKAAPSRWTLSAVLAQLRMEQDASVQSNAQFTSLISTLEACISALP
jgi:hypothetical protein